MVGSTAVVLTIPNPNIQNGCLSLGHFIYDCSLTTATHTHQLNIENNCADEDQFQVSGLLQSFRAHSI